MTTSQCYTGPEIAIKTDADAYSILTSVPDKDQITLKWQDVSANVLNKWKDQSLSRRAWARMGPKRKEGSTEPPRMKQILHNISGEVCPGELLAMMGPSGSGKTTLLSILGARSARIIKTSGAVTCNGCPLSKPFRRRVGYVLQDDLLFENLTVYETLRFAALLRLPRDMAEGDKLVRVEAIIRVLGLQKCRDTLIGGYLRRGISGGERKRTSIGHELLTNPSVLLLDEPTSGLDSTTAMHLMTTLRQLATGGRAIATTIHQPSSRLYQQLDRLLLLAEGHAMYYGSSNRAMEWFSQLGFPMPFVMSVADYVLDLATGEVVGNGPAVELKGPPAIKALYKSFERYQRTHPAGFDNNQPLHDVILVRDAGVERPSTVVRLEDVKGAVHMPGGEEGSEYNLVVVANCPTDSPSAGTPTHAAVDATTVATAAAAATTGTVAGAAPRADAGKDEASGVSGIVGGSSHLRASGGGCSTWLRPWRRTDQHDGLQGSMDRQRPGAAYWQQVAVLWQRAVKTRRFEAVNGQRMFQQVAVALVAGMFWWQSGHSRILTGASDIIGLLFFIMLFMGLRNMFAALFTFPAEYRMLLKERSSGMYQLSAYYLARQASDLPMDCLLPSVFLIILYFMGGLQASAGAFFATWAASLVLVLIAQSVGLLLGAIFMDPKTAQTVSTVVMMSLMLVGGYYVRNIPDWIAWLRYISFIYWAYNLILKIQLHDETFYQCSSPPGGGVPTCATVPNLSSSLQLPTDVNSSPALEVGVLLGLLVALRFVVYVVLRYRTRGL